MEYDYFLKQILSELVFSLSFSFKMTIFSKNASLSTRTHVDTAQNRKKKLHFPPSSTSRISPSTIR